MVDHQGPFQSNEEAKKEQRKDYHRKFRRQTRGLGPHGSSTPGKTKGPNCMANRMDRFFAKYNRGHRHPDYPAWCQKKRG